MLSNKKLNPIVTELFIKERKLNILLLLLHNLTIVFTISFRKFQTKENFNKLHLTIHQIFAFKTLIIFIKSLRQNQILLWLLILLFHQIIIYVLERNFQKQYKS